ncbi:WD40 repeat domain-containing protein, partial [Streptomyces sp. NPDC004561]
MPVPRRPGPGRDGTVADAFDVHVLSVGPVAGYPDADTAAEATAVLDVLRRIGGQPAARPADEGQPVAGTRPATVDSLGAADDELARWSGEYGDNPGHELKDRPSALVWLGHGRVGTMGPTLLLPGSREREGHAQITPDMFAHHLFTEWRNRRSGEGHWAIVVIEACKSADFAAGVKQRFDRPPGADDDPYSILLIATGKGSAQAYLGTFRKTLDAYLDGLTSHDRVFELHDLRRHFKQDSHYAEFGGESCHELKLALRDRVPLPGVTTVAEQQRLQGEFDAAPLAVPLTEQPPQDPEHTGILEVVPHFTGRTAELAELERWCAEPGTERVLIVPGAPGVGKSAFLGEELRRLRRVSPGDTARPRLGAVLRLTGSTPEEIRTRLEQVPELRASGVLSGDHAPTASDAPSGPADRLLILADALDEARDPVRTAFLLRAATDHPRVTLIIGTRPAPGDGAPHGDGSRVDLPTVLGSNTERARVMELLPDPVAAAEYAADGVRRVLREHPVPDPVWPERVAATVREAVEQHVRDGSWQFLQVSLLVQEIEQNPQVLSQDPASRDALQRLLRKDRTGLFGAAVERITRDQPTALPFLRALALAHGRGLPRVDGIWLRAATALAAADATGADGPPDERALTDFLAKAAAYVLLDGEDRRSVYRLAHRTYADRLAADVTPGQRLAMLTAMLDLAVDQAAERRPLSPHLESRLAEYAADCGTPGWRQLARYPAVLDRLRTAVLCGLALAPGRHGGGAAPTDLPVEVLGTITSAHLIERSQAADRPGLRQLGGLRACGTLRPAGTGAAWEVRWGAVRRTPPHLQLDAGQMVTAVAAHPERPWLVSGSRDGSVMLWEPWRTHVPVLLMRAGESPVTAVAASGSEGAGPVVAAHDDRVLHIWHTGADGAPAPAAPQRVETPHTIWQLAALPDGRFAVAGDAGWVAVLDPGQARLSPAPSAAGSDVVGLAPLTGARGRQWLAVAERAGDIVLWDVSEGVPEYLDTLSLRQPLAAVTAVGGAELVMACPDGSVWRWDAADRQHSAVRLAAPDDTAPPRMGASPPVLAAWQAGAGRQAVLWGDQRGLWA